MNLNTEIQERLQLAEKVCKKNNARLTHKRRKVLKLLLQTEKAISAYELIDLYKKQYDEVLMPMTAYRTLEFLEGMHLSHRLNIANKYIGCAHIGCTSTHELPHFLICDKCLRVEELSYKSACNSSELVNKAKQNGYQLSSPQIELSGVCSKCRCDTK